MTETATRLLNPEQKQVNPESYITIQGWMLTELNLKGASLLIYAIIYGFSQDRKSCFQGTAKYLADWASVSVYTVYDILKKLCSQGLIEKIEKEVNGVKVYDYRTTKTSPPVVKDHHPGDKRTPPPVVKDQLDNINIDKLIDNNKKTYTKKVFTKPTIEELRNYCREQNLSIDCEYFFDYYESNGWKVSNSPMKDWQATIRNWARREKEYNRGRIKNGEQSNKYAGLGREFSNEY